MPKGIYERKPKGPVMANETAAQPSPQPAEKMFPVVLNKNYAPSGRYEIVGWLKPKVERKDSTGRMLTIEPEKFMEGEMHPAPYPGTGFPNKIWAGTTIRLPLEEAKAIVGKKIATRADDLAA